MAAQLEQARGSEHAFLLSISHDLRTPLTSIRGYAEALADGTLDDADPNDRKRAATIIGAEGRRLERLVEDLLDLSRLDSHQFSLNPRPCDATEVVRDAGEAFAPQARELGIALNIVSGDPLGVDLDPERLAQIVANLIENALKYATAKVEVYAAMQSPTQLAIVVVDDGPGIPGDRWPASSNGSTRSGRRPAAPSVPGSGSRSCASSPRRWAATPGPKPRPAAEPGSWSRCPPRRGRPYREEVKAYTRAGPPPRSSR